MGAGFGSLGGLSEKKMGKVFLHHDKDKSGTVDNEELLAMMVEMKLGTGNKAENVKFLADYMHESGADKDGDGMLDFDEFKVFCKAAKKNAKSNKSKFETFVGGISEDDMLTTFLNFDKDASGTVCVDELLTMMNELGLGAENPDDNVEFLMNYLMMTDVDDNENGNLNFDEFQMFCKSAADDTESKKKGGGSKVAPSSLPVQGYSDEANQHLADKKKEAARDKAAVAARNAKTAKENKDRIKRVSMTKSESSKQQDNKEYEKMKKEKAKQRKQEAADKKKRDKAHEAEVKAKAKELKKRKSSMKN